MQFQKLVWIRVHVALKQFKVAFAESSQECPCKPRSQFSHVSIVNRQSSLIDLHHHGQVDKVL